MTASWSAAPGEAAGAQLLACAMRLLLLEHDGQCESALARVSNSGPATRSHVAREQCAADLATSATLLSALARTSSPARDAGEVPSPACGAVVNAFAGAVIIEAGVLEAAAETKELGVVMRVEELGTALGAGVSGAAAETEKLEAALDVVGGGAVCEALAVGSTLAVESGGRPIGVDGLGASVVVEEHWAA